MAILRIKDENGNVYSIPSIKGEKGDPGAQGEKGETGAQGPQGNPGKDAYEYAKEGGFTGTEEDFNNELANIKNKLTTNDVESLIDKELEKFSGTIEITPGDPEKENTVLIIDPNSNSVTLYTAEEIDEIKEELENKIPTKTSQLNNDNEFITNEEFLTSRTHYIEKVNITFDGNTEGLEEVDISAAQGYEEGTLIAYKISDVILTLEELDNAIINFNPSSGIKCIKYYYNTELISSFPVRTFACVDSTDDEYFVRATIMIAHTAGDFRDTEGTGITIPSTGMYIWIESWGIEGSLNISAEKHHTLDPQFIPQSIARTEEMVDRIEDILTYAKESGEFDGVGIQWVKQTTTSNIDGGENVVDVRLTNGTTYSFSIKNGSKGSPGDIGPEGIPGPKGDPGQSGVYVGSGEMPEGCNIKIDPEGEADEFVTKQEFNNVLGDIDKALDTIIEIQEGLLGR